MPNPSAFWKMTPFNPNKEEQEPNDAMIFGNYMHKRFLEPQKAEKEYMVFDFGKSRRNKKFLEMQNKLKEEGVDKILISPDEKEKADAMCIALSNNKFVMDLISGAYIEKPLFMHDDEIGLDFKGKLDVIKRLKEGLVVIDYKTTNDVTKFLRYSHVRGLHIQEAMYNKLVAHKYKEQPIQFLFIVQSTKEGEEDHIAVCEFCEQRKEEGKHLLDALSYDISEFLEKYKTDGESVWQAYPQEILTLR
jgi:hypothetical protein